MAEQAIASAVERTLANKPMLMSMPNSSALTDLYPSVSNSTSHLVECVNRSGSIRISPNSKLLGATSNFSVSSSLLLYNPTLNISITQPANHIMFDGWGLQAIETLELSFANSLAQNMIISGTALRDLLLYCQSDPEKRNLVFKQCGNSAAGAGVAYASIPLACLINRAQISNTFPLDFSTMNGFLQINITWNNAQKFMMVNSTNPAAAFPTQLTTCELTFCSSAITDAGFGVKNALLSDPMYSYNIPNTWVSPYVYHRDIQANAGAKTELSVTSCPKGQCHGFLLSLVPTTEFQAAANGQTLTYPSSVNLNTLRVQYNGIDLFRADNYQELNAYYRYKHNGDDLSFRYSFYAARVVANHQEMLSKVYFVPFNYNSGLCRSQLHHETLPSYDGATIQIEFTVDTINRIRFDGATPYTPLALATAGAAAAEDYRIEITWLLSSLVEITQSGIDIQR